MRDDAGGRPADHRRRPGRLADRASRCSAPMAAASSTPMPRIRSRTPTRISNLIQMVSIFAIGAALTNVFGRMVGNQRQGLGDLRRHGRPVRRRRRRLLLGRGRRQSAGPCARHRRRQHGRQGGPLRRRASSALFAVVTTAASCGAVNAMHGSFTALGGLDPAHQHGARRGHHRRRRRRLLRHRCCSSCSPSSSPG